MKKKFKKITFTMFSFAFLLLAYGCDSHDSGKCYQSVKNKYKNDNVLIIPGEPYRFLVEKEDGSIIFVRTLYQFSAEISDEYVLIDKSK